MGEKCRCSFRNWDLANLSHIFDPKLMARYRILPTPDLIINWKVKSKGTVPPKSVIKKWLEELLCHLLGFTRSTYESRFEI